MNSSDNQDSLSRELAEWRVVPRRNPQFRAAVWARLESVRTTLPWAAYARAHAAVLAGALALALLAGGWAGSEQAQARVASQRAKIATSYVQSLDARTMTMP